MSAGAGGPAGGGNGGSGAGPAGAGQSGGEVTATRRAERQGGGVDIEALAERVYKLLQDDLRLTRLRRDGHLNGTTGGGPP